MHLGLRGWITIWAGWTALALLFAVSTSLTYVSTGRPANWSLTISRALSEWWLWAVLTPAVFALARQFPLAGARRWRHLALHLLAGTALAAAKTVVDRALFAWISGFWIYLLASTLALQFVVYAVIVAAAHGLEYYRRSREREQLEKRVTEMRLQLLNMQLQPHFLFNTLNTIAELVHHDADTADRMITGLSDLLRGALDLGTQQVIALEKEVELLRLYVDIQQARFGERLQVSIIVDEDVRAAMVPALLLQPLVENAIRHGLAKRVAAGRIAVHARRTGGEVRIDVANDGPEGPPEDGALSERVGLGITRARLEALYGAAHRLTLSRTDGGARVSIQIPFIAREGIA
jgi:signal transduction histidine kinase